MVLKKDTEKLKKWLGATCGTSKDVFQTNLGKKASLANVYGDSLS
jgi:hypothetical protein